ncbi:helix-turn-helix domain-containing protein [Carnobacterium divergens]|nr:helix-turn-helix domain-containing protein [Carnobacterium divergens]MDV8935125.1 helix-turn-helix domain-containing protein [Carnobacterium sp.]MDT1940888.1 helix-turn-helix domain-containing protein [Carnobacterium divergens]MDT1943327.1 helix-turn-helix domain-containing protein [Carnobacterium divergens]MDT1947975.1 helix-turn-helix domain-containing protein [Carnobacterium divergens]
MVYQSVIDKLNKGKAISRIAKELDISRPTVYKIKYEYEQQHEKSNAT